MRFLLLPLGFIFALLFESLALAGAPLVNQISRLPVGVSGATDLKFAIIEVEKNPTRAIAKANVKLGAVSGLQLLQAGDGYESPPVVNLVSESGKGARAVARVAGGRIIDLKLLAAGRGYERPPEVRISSPTAELQVRTLWSNDGTSVAGSEPQLSVSLNVLGGTYAALLGYTGLPNMAALPAEIFSHLEARLRVWYRGSSGEFIRVVIDEPLQASPYADASGFAASIADGSITSGKLGAGAVTAEKLAEGSVNSSKLGTGETARSEIVNSLGLVEAATPADRALEREIWIALRTDGRAGSGTADDPFDGSTSAKFDALLRRFADAAHRVNGRVLPLTIRLGAGTFLTMGSALGEPWPVPYPGSPPYPRINSGWLMHSGWRLLGAGEGLTTIKLERWPQINDAPYSYGHTVISSSDGSPGYWGDDCEVAYLTVDCNWQNLQGRPPQSAVKLDAVVLSGDRVKIHNVTAENAYGDIRSATEGFTIAWTGVSTGIYFRENGYPDLGHGVSGGEIKECHVRKWQGNYGVAIVAFSGSDGRGGVVRDNVVEGYHPATCAFQATGRGNLFTGNRTLDCTSFMHLDSSTVVDTLVAQNVALNCRETAIDIVPGFPDADFQRLTFQDNILEVNSDALHPWVIHLDRRDGKLRDVTLRGNRLSQTRASVLSGAYGCVLASTSGLTVQDNWVHSSLNNLILNCTGVAIRQNLTETGAVPHGLTTAPVAESFGGNVAVAGELSAAIMLADYVHTRPGGVVQADSFAFADDASTGVIAGGKLLLGDMETVSLDWLSRRLGGGSWTVGDGGFAFSGSGKADTLKALGLRQHLGSLKKTRPQILPTDGTFAKLTWDAALWDYETLANVPEGKLTAHVSGVYRVDFRCAMETRPVQIALYKNGALLCPLFRGTAGATTATVSVALAAGDSLEIWAAAPDGEGTIAGSVGEVLNTTFSLTLEREN